MGAYLRVAEDAVDDPGESQEHVRVVVADDRDLARRGVREVIAAEQDVELVAEADVLAAGREVERARPRVLVLDLLVRDGSSIAAIGELRERAPDTEIVVLSSGEDALFAQRVLAAGALAYVSREHARRELARAIRAAARRERYVSAALAARMQALDGASGHQPLTPRELEVLRLIAHGHTSVEIAEELRLSPRTVETHRAHIHRKLGVSTRAELVRDALGRGLLRR